MKRIDANFANRWPSDPHHLRVGDFSDECTSLGPGVRAVLWVQGCCFRCPGCASPDMLHFEGGTVTRVSDIGQRLIDNPAINGVTFSGGEPFMQAAGIARLIDHVKLQRPELTFMSYSGFTLTELRAAAEPDQLALLQRLDLLVDGRFRRELYVPLRWRGSSNQKIHFLSDCHNELSEEVDEPTRSIDVTINPDGSIVGAGIPWPGLDRDVRRSMKQTGFVMNRRGD